ncbi:hypothetical protein CYMTET_41090 [Cymbomonas tetramitiformis]|uniref:NADH:ubiquinone oxidoreductase intermediate-associated protein 30 domain-containing protein n=1 Tax=Cymbomonas tetramitiformis TaxID=36881 RepID=A0AAE0C6T5_9CHLO|nr:hypothetical protein CYMTET_41090 [Cymbomonas tetramitiformis]
MWADFRAHDGRSPYIGEQTQAMFAPLVLPQAPSTPHRALCTKNAARTNAHPRTASTFPKRVGHRISCRVRQLALSGAHSAKRSQGRSAVCTRAAASDGSSGEVAKGALLDLSSYDDRVPAAGAFERVDDVVMGGVSSSKLVPAKQRECLVWSGQCRTDGGGFAGMRTKPLSKGLDLSQWQGLALCCALESDAEPERRTWKATLRTQNDRGEVVYQAPFVPPVASSPDNLPAPVYLPWESFRLVRGPVVVPDVPPLSAEECTAVFGLGLIMSRFGPQGPMQDFRSGAFRLAIHSLDVYNTSPAADATAPEQLDSLTTTSAGTANKGTRTLLTFLLAPILAIVFSEAARRRRQARTLLKKRYGWGAVKIRGFGQQLKRQRMSALMAAQEGSLQLSADALSAILALPLRLLFMLSRQVGKVIRRLKGQKPLPSMR